MARKPSVDVDKVIQMLREGASTQSVADRFGVSRQAIDLHRRKFIQSGQLVGKRAPRRQVVSSESAEAKGEVSAPKGVEAETTGYQPSLKTGPQKTPKSSETVSLDRMIELIIEAFDSLKQVPRLETELEKYKRDYEKAAEKIEQLEQVIAKRAVQEARWKMVVPPREAGSS